MDPFEKVFWIIRIVATLLDVVKNLSWGPIKKYLLKGRRNTKRASR